MYYLVGGIHFNKWDKADVDCMRNANKCPKIPYSAISTMVKKINKNLAIANRSRVSCAHNTLRASMGLNSIP